MVKKYFVTGGTGVIGSALVPLLLEDKKSQVWMLMRADSHDHLTRRLEDLIAFWEMDAEQAQDARQRIIPLQGDTDQSKFALADAVYAEVAQKCTHIIHCAGVVRMNLPLEQARRHALGSAQNIVELALVCQQASGLPIKIEYVSTVGVAGRMAGLVPETWITQPRDFHNTYEQSKAEAEDYLRAQVERYHLPLTVHRPSMVVGDSKTGKIIHFQIFYHLCEFISGRRTFGILPFLGDARLDTVPVDYVAGVIRWSSGQGANTAGKIFHLCSGPELSIRLTHLQQIVRSQMQNGSIKLPLLITVPSVIFTLFLNLASSIVNENLKRPMKAFPIFVDYLADKQAFDNEQTVNFLADQFNSPLIKAERYLEHEVRTYLVLKYQ
jgi:thioester reductase-like protein